MDRNVLAKEKEKVDKYMDLTIELQRVWGTIIKTIPLIFGPLNGTISNNLFTHMASLSIKNLKVAPNSFHKCCVTYYISSEF